MSIRIFLNRKILSIPVLKRWNSVVLIAAHRSTRAIPNANTAAPDYEKTKKHPQGCFLFCKSPLVKNGILPPPSAEPLPPLEGRCLRRRRKGVNPIPLNSAGNFNRIPPVLAKPKPPPFNKGGFLSKNGRIISAPTVIVMMFLLL